MCRQATKIAETDKDRLHAAPRAPFSETPDGPAAAMSGRVTAPVSLAMTPGAQKTVLETTRKPDLIIIP